MLAIVFDNWLEICFLSLVSSIQVARLACVLLGSLVKLSYSFCKRSVLAPRRWLMLLLARWSHQWLLFGFKGPLQYLTLFYGLVPRMRSCCGLLSLLYSTASGSEYNLLHRVCRTWPRQVLDRTFCYQRLIILNCIRFWIELLLLESCLTQQHQDLSRPLAIGVV